MNEVGYVPPVSPGGPVAGVWAVPDSISWTNARRFGDVHVAIACAPGQHLGLDRLLERLLGHSRGSWRAGCPRSPPFIAVNRLVDPRSERGIHLHWLPGTALL